MSFSLTWMGITKNVISGFICRGTCFQQKCDFKKLPKVQSMGITQCGFFCSDIWQWSYWQHQSQQACAVKTSVKSQLKKKKILKIRAFSLWLFQIFSHLVSFGFFPIRKRQIIFQNVWTKKGTKCKKTTSSTE